MVIDMNFNSYFSFLKFYYHYTNEKNFFNYSDRNHTSKKARFTYVILAYIFFISSFFSILFFKKRGLFFIGIGAFFLSGLLYLAEFSLTYYYFLYKKIKKSNNSINDKVFIDEKILMRVAKIRSTISKYYRIINSSAHLFYIKYILLDRPTKKKITMKIYSNKLCLNGKKICNKSINDRFEFEKIIKDAKI